MLGRSQTIWKDPKTQKTKNLRVLQGPEGEEEEGPLKSAERAIRQKFEDQRWERCVGWMNTLTNSLYLRKVTTVCIRI